MLRMPSKDCQAGKGRLKRTVLVRPGPNWDKKHWPSGRTIAQSSEVIDNIEPYGQVQLVLMYR